MQSAEIRQRVKDLMKTLTSSFFELGQLLYEIRFANMFLDWGYSSFEEYTEMEIGYKRRAAEHHIEIWEELHQKRGIPEERIAHIGWSKVRTIMPVVKESNNKRTLEKWLKRAETHSRRELATLIKRERDGEEDQEEPPKRKFERKHHDTEEELEGVHERTDSPFVDPAVIQHREFVEEDEETGDKIPLHEFKVYCYKEQWANIMAAMERAGQLTNSDKANYLLDMICLEFNETYAETEDGGVVQTLDRHVKNLERIFDVKIEVEIPASSKLRKMARLDDESKSKASKKRKKAAEEGEEEEKPKKKAKAKKKKVAKKTKKKSTKAKKDVEETDTEESTESKKPEYRW